MKIQKLLYSSLLVRMVCVASLLTTVACGDSLLDDMSVNDEIVSGEIATAETKDQAAGMFLQAQSLIHDLREHKYQYQFNLHIDNYCGYLCLPQNFDGRQPSTYYVNKDFGNGPRQSFFWTAEQTLPVMRGAEKLDLAEIGAMANIMFCYSAQELADVYGPFPWWDYKIDKQDPPLTYYSVEEIYDSIFVDLKKSITILENFNQTTDEHQQEIMGILQNKDRICGGKIKNWIKFANSLRLRMAMHISVVAPEKAKAIAKEALQSGVLVSTDKNIEYDITLEGKRNPLEFISSVWKDTRLNASFENLLRRMNSPMLAKWFDKNYDDIKDLKGNIAMGRQSEIIGIRAGLTMEPRSSSNPYDAFSPVSTSYAQRPVTLMKVVEVLFLQAEAAIRWGEDFTDGMPAQLLYEDAIYRSFKDEGVADDVYFEYIGQVAPKNIDYVDPHDSYNNKAGIVTIGVAWDDNDSRELQLEKIMTQKYIANYPMGLEAWTDIRRTGFPRIFSVVDDDGDGSIPEGDIIRRIPYPINDDSDRNDIITSAIPLLGRDEQGTRLWWDTGNLF